MGFIKKVNNTCIAVLKMKNGKLMMGGDRRASWGMSQAQSMPRPKVNKRDGVLLGGTGSGYLCTLIVDIMPIPEINKGDDLDTYMHFSFTSSIYNLLTINNFVDKDKILKIPSDEYCEILVGVSNHLYQVCLYNPDPEKIDSQGLISVDELSLPYATGCGGHWAWGSLRTTELLGLNYSKERMKIALEVAADFSPGCDYNVDIIVED